MALALIFLAVAGDALARLLRNLFSGDDKMPLALSADVLARLWPHALPGMIDGVSKSSAAVLAKYKIATLPELIDFMAECSEETGGMTRVVESGAYSAERAHEVWPGLFPTAASAAPYVISEKLLFNHTYGARLGNIPNTGDGYNFRGRGMIQITGRSWYEKIGSASGLDLVDNPDLASSPDHILECAAAFWALDDVNKFADSGDFQGEVRRVNGGLTNMAARLEWRATCSKFLTLSTAMTAGAVPQPTATQPEVDATFPSIKSIQARLNALGASPPLELDGEVGPATRAAINRVIGIVESAKAT